MAETGPGPDFHPLYLQIKELLIQRVLAGDWKPGKILPSESKLAAEYHVSQGTVRKALDEMTAEHLVVRHQGKGTFVTAREGEAPIHFFSIVNAAREPVGLRETLSMEWTVAPASAPEREELGLTPDDAVIRIYRVRSIDGEPAISEDIIIEEKRFPGFGEMLSKAARVNTYLIMEREFGTLVVRADEYVNAVPAGPREVAALGVAEGYPLLKIARISYGLDGTPVESRAIRLKSDRYYYFNRVS